MATIAPPAPGKQGFPIDEVTKALVNELLLIATDEAQVRGIVLPGNHTLLILKFVIFLVAQIQAVEAIIEFQFLFQSPVQALVYGRENLQALFDHSQCRPDRLV